MAARKESNPEALIQQARRARLKRLVTQIRSTLGTNSGAKLSIFAIYFNHRVNFPSGFLRFFRLVFQRMTDIEKGFADNHDDRRNSDVPAFFRGLRSAISVGTGEKCK